MKYIFMLFVFLGGLCLAGLLYLYSEVRFDAYKIIDYKPKVSSQIYDKNGVLLANIFDDKHRLYAPYNEIPPRVIEALVAIEDTSFFEHKGINPEAIFRAILKDIKAMKMVEGASTITQQLIKNIALSPEKKIMRKLKEMVLAFKIETSLTKEEILERYLNQVYFGHQFYGIKTAARGYFRKDLKTLTLKEIAMLVGLPKAPSSYDPTKHLDLALSRANRVLGRMEVLGWISEEDYKAGLKEKPEVFDDTLTQNKAPYVVDQVIKEASERFPDIKTGGYKIYLGIDLKVQNEAKIALKDGYLTILKRITKKPKKGKKQPKDANITLDTNTSLNGAVIVMENKTGNILALVGGVNYEKSSFNRAVQSRRQPGSSFKPFLYQKALDLGYSPMSLIPDISRIYGTRKKDQWKPKNYGGKFSGLVTMKEALVHSKNLATINLLEAIGLDTLHKKLTESGFENIPMDLSIALGSFGISPLQYARFYSAFPNYGEMVTPRLITSIEDRKGEVYNYEIEKEEFTTPEQAFLMVDMMREVVNRGTGYGTKMKDIELAGKTGTTNKNVDAWFCGYSPDIEILIWYGKDDNKPIGRRETGGMAAVPVFKDLMSRYLKLYPQTTRKFTKPKGVSEVIINGKKEYFTETSQLPSQSPSQNTQNASELLF